MTNEQMIARCKANAMTMVRLAKESGKLNGQGLEMLDSVNSWLSTVECQFTNLGYLGDAPTKLDLSMVQDLYKAYKEAMK